MEGHWAWTHWWLSLVTYMMPSVKAGKALTSSHQISVNRAQSIACNARRSLGHYMLANRLFRAEDMPDPHVHNRPKGAHRRVRTCLVLTRYSGQCSRQAVRGAAHSLATVKPRKPCDSSRLLHG